MDTEVRHVNFARFVSDQCGNELRYVQHVGWFKWNGVVWEATGDDGAAMQAVTAAAKVLMQRSIDNPADMVWTTAAASKMLVNHQRRAMVAEMTVLPQLHATVDDMDAQRHLLTFRNGTVDLRNSELRPHDPADMLTQCTRVDYVPDAECPRWLRFVDEVFPGDKDLQRYYQTFLGMAVTGEVRDHALGVWYGAQGRNGKGATIRTMQKVFGDEVVHEVPFTTFESVRGQQVHTEQIASLRGKRLVVAQEGNQGVPMNTALLKNLSGGDRINTRHLHGKVFTFEPTFTLILATNHLPEFASGGAALWARTKAILFGQSFAGRVDKNLEPTIQGSEREGVAAWVIEGAKRYYTEGLIDPISVEKATEHHRDAVDPLKDLVGELFDYEENVVTVRSHFNAELKKWRDVNGDTSAKFKPQSVRNHLSTRGVREVKRRGEWCLAGIRLMPEFGGPVITDVDGPGIFTQD
ncbi:DNA primase family protein [Streptomyces europaeiscabiei]|uniref:DNA primase family protein n=1 Tax=Streptomyces europaeiscabiei TaxID=146819 RepID=UPI0029A64C41|nr:phage/plasmid primase, P4 family [Streptomyces europaeiscabiei]MDX2772280.1 phage/plasmid primase, P4 family [Streptomyces europaeiscabiei]